MSWSPRWSPLRVLIFILLVYSKTRPIVAMEETSLPQLIVPASHTALSRDLTVMILDLPSVSPLEIPDILKSTTTTTTSTSTTNIPVDEDSEDYDFDKTEDDIQTPYVLRVLRLDEFTSELVGQVPVETHPPTGGNLSLTIPCGFFSRGGTYSIRLQSKSEPPPPKFANIANLHQVQMRSTLDVRWPIPSLSIEPQHLETYPIQPVLATLEYTGVSCQPSPGVPITTYSLQLIFCGVSVLSCDPRNKTLVQMLYTEEVKGFPTQKVVKLRCEFFGLAGHYALRLKPSEANPNAPTTSAYIKVEWSEQFVFNVHARSVYPCDSGSGGVSVLFEYPSCRLPEDRVRVYGRLRADVASLAPPSSLHYVAELKAPPGKHTLTFDCDIFTERFVEYCFVYVSQAITGAMAEVRVGCIPTFPLEEGDAGGWSPWSQWSRCSSSCVGGTRTRYRLCDSPPPRYGAQFCQGDAVDSEACGGTAQLDLHGSLSQGDWECRHGRGLAADRPEVTAEVGTKCRCGCVLNMNAKKMRTILAASTQACPGRSFWLIQTTEENVIRLNLDQAKFPCPGQYVRVRDGDSLSAELLVDVAFDRKEPPSAAIVSSKETLLLEFFSDPTLADGESCIGGFLAHLLMIGKPQGENETTLPTTVFLKPTIIAAAGRWAQWLTPAHLVAASLLLLTFLASVFLALQYALKYRKYHVAEDLDSLADNSSCSDAVPDSRRVRTMSSSTLISEVVSLVRLPIRGTSKHTRLEETPADVEDGYESTETPADAEEEQSTESGTRRKKDDENGSEKTLVPSAGSTPLRRPSTSNSSASGQPEVKYARPVKLRTVGPISPVSEEALTSEDSRRYSSTSASTSLNNSFSPASSSCSNASTLRCGKDSKERRNRERLLQGPGSEFSLSNPEGDLEMDYYDYNVVNAAAAPGSYLGMDPAFLVWIPPLGSDESDILDTIDENNRPEECDDSKGLDTEGASLTADEYEKIKTANQELEDDTGDEILPRRLDPGESRLHDEIITEYRARLREGMLPIHRILEESRVRVSEESLARQVPDECGEVSAEIIPNKFHSDLDSRGDVSSTRSLGRGQKKNNLDTPKARRAKDRKNVDLDRDKCEEKDYENETCKPKTLNISMDYVDIVKLNVVSEKDKVAALGDIPMTEFSRNRQDSPVKVHRTKDKGEFPSEKEIPSPDYGVETDVKKNSRDSFYDLIGEGEDSIKFADDDDEYLDNKATV
ncbi:uncharacterized protein LOC122498264 isoform X2 [Leptopilina heterotoma]|uniref:uncharacterized protein LOC122498264 isoform X2 n=1 Tax=Leptopilina heterotoma TaxID=63436 RepID=UPI001CA831F2|nr:uncharacterized protein LOC122498264 isoform X2 [Leptopilina heterotoma]